MKCNGCGNEIPEGESLCPFCGEHSDEQARPVKNNKKWWILAAVLAAVGVVAGSMVVTTQPKLVSAQDAAKQHTMISYNTAKELYTLLPENHQELLLYKNNAKDLSSYSTFDQIISGNSAYIGKDNFVRLGGEVLFLQTTLSSYDSASGSLDANYQLCSVKNGKVTVIDEGVQGISCASDKSVYYMKIEDGAVVQYHYSNGTVTPVNEIIEGDVVMVTHCSNDDSVLGFVSVFVDGEGGYLLNNGYKVGIDIYRFGHGESEVYYVSEDGQHIYVIDIPAEGGRAVDMRYINTKSGESMELVTAATDISFYDADGSMTCIGQVELKDDVMNPVGSVIHFDPSSKVLTTVADYAVALVESVPKTYTWLNEAANEMLVGEQGNRTQFEKTVKDGAFHYIDANGSFCAADLSGNTLEVFKNFYAPEDYVYSSDVFYLSEQDGAFYWAEMDKIYKYTAGSMKEAEIVTLYEDMLSKIGTGMEMGYVLSGDGSVLEQSGNTLTLKPFGGASYSVYDSESLFYVVGLSEKGDKIYLSTESGQIMEKEIRENSEVRLVAENVQKAVAVENGLYFLQNYVEEDGGSLMYMNYDSGKISKIRDGVLGLADVALQ